MPNSASRLLQFPVERRRWIRPPRMLRRIVRTATHSIDYSPSYTLTYWTQTLECGHKVQAFTIDQLSAVRRLCPTCSNILRKTLSAPLIQLTSVRKESHHAG